MNKDFTPEELIAHLYNENEPSARARLQATLETDSFLREQFELLSKTKGHLDTEKIPEPSQSSIDAILSYARKLEKEEESLQH